MTKLFVIAGFLLALSVANLPAQQQERQPAASFDALSSRAMAALDADRLDDAIPLFKQALALNPRWAEGWWSLGTAYYDEDKFADASLAFQKVVALDPRHGTARAFLGLCQSQLGQMSEALRNLEAGRKLGLLDDKQLWQTVFFHEGILRQRAGRFEEAKESFASLCRAGPINADARRIFGMVALRLTDSAPPAGVEARLLDQLGGAECLSAQKKFDQAKVEFQAAVSEFPHQQNLHEAFGEFLMDAGDNDGAAVEFQKEIAESPQSVLPRLRICAAMYKQNSAGALPYAKEALQLAPKAPFAHYMHGLLLLDTGDYKGAIPELEIAHKGFPKEAKIDFVLGTAYAHDGRAQDAARVRLESQRLRQAEQQSNPGNSQAQEGDAASQVSVTGALDSERAVNPGAAPQP